MTPFEMIRSKFVTFAVHAADKVSVASHEHATLHFCVMTGSVSILSRETTRSVARKWDVIGEWEFLATDHVSIAFHNRCNATALCATQMKRMGVVVFGMERSDYYLWDDCETIALASDGIVTNPDTILGTADTEKDRVGRNTARKRADTQMRFGAIGTVDTDAMRKRIVEARIRRATIARS